jgi:outer membrane protein W
MKNIMLTILIISGITFAQKFGVSIGTGTFSGNDEYSPKHLTGHFYMPLNDKFSFDFSLGAGGANYSIEGDYEPSSTHDDYENTVKTTGANLEAGFIYSHRTGSVFEPYAGLGLGIYSYTRDEENEQGNFESEASFSGLGQFITFGLDMKVSEKFTAFVQFKKLGLSYINVNDERNYGNDNNDVDESYDYLAKPGTNDLGISAGLKFSF